jgi:hypothetical protein
MLVDGVLFPIINLKDKQYEGRYARTSSSTASLMQDKIQKQHPKKRYI